LPSKLPFFHQYIKPHVCLLLTVSNLEISLLFDALDLGWNHFIIIEVASWSQKLPDVGGFESASL